MPSVAVMVTVTGRGTTVDFSVEAIVSLLPFPLLMPQLWRSTKASKSYPLELATTTFTTQVSPARVAVTDDALTLETDENC
jgi:hypothetical protein